LLSINENFVIQSIYIPLKLKRSFFGPVLRNVKKLFNEFHLPLNAPVHGPDCSPGILLIQLFTLKQFKRAGDYIHRFLQLVRDGYYTLVFLAVGGLATYAHITIAR
jgi:hypothetical protein